MAYLHVHTFDSDTQHTLIFMTLIGNTELLVQDDDVLGLDYVIFQL